MVGKDGEKSPIQRFEETLAIRREYLKRYIPSLDDKAIDEILRGAPTIQQQENAAHLAQAIETNNNARTSFCDRFQRALNNLENLTTRTLSRAEKKQLAEGFKPIEKEQTESAQRIRGVIRELRDSGSPAWSLTSGKGDIPPFLGGRDRKSEQNNIENMPTKRIEGSPWGIRLETKDNQGNTGNTQPAQTENSPWKKDPWK